MKLAKTEIIDCLSVSVLETVRRIDLSNVVGGDESHYFPEIFYVEEGSHTTYLDDVPYHLNAGQMIIYAPNAFHRGEPGVVSTAKVCIVCFEVEHCTLDGMCNRIIDLTDEQKEMLIKTVAIGETLFERASPDSGFKGMTLREGASRHELQKLKHMLELFLIDVLGVGEAADSTVRRVDYKKVQFENIVKYLRSQMNRTLTLEDIAAVSRISVSSLSALFKEQSGCSPIAYFNDMKIDEAQRLIRETGMNFTEIAEAVGVGSIHYFSKLFKKKTGMTPTEYAKSLRG